MKRYIITALVLAGILSLCGCGTNDERSSTAPVDEPTAENGYTTVTTTEHEPTMSVFLGNQLPWPDYIQDITVLLDIATSYQITAETLSYEDYTNYLLLMQDMGWEITWNADGIAYASKDDGTLRSCVQRCAPDDERTFIHVWANET